MWSGVSTRPELNYQLQAFEIETKWVSYRVPSNYYKSGNNKVGYLRGEVYSFGIQWLFDNGEWSNVYHIPGRQSVPKEIAIASGRDVFEVNEDKDKKIARKYFEIFDTSSVEPSSSITKSKTDVVNASGNMSYWEGVDLYGDNKILYGDNSCKPIRHHKTPDECNAPRYEQVGKYINILGVQFSKIPHPKNADGSDATDVVGYRIVRGDREGNRSIIARGLMTNVRYYNEKINTDGTTQEVRYPNYPYNDLSPDSLISSEQTYNSSRGENKFRALTGVKSDEFNFYSPHALFGKVGLGNELLIETEESAIVDGYFEYVYNHPKSKFLDNSVFWLAITLGAIDGVLSLFGKKCVTGLKSGVVNVTNLTSTPPSNITITAAGMKVVQSCEDLVSGLPWADLIHLPAVEAAAKGALKVLQYAVKAGMSVAFAYKTANDFLDMVYSIQSYKKYAVQYNSHGLFNSSECTKKDNKRKKIEYYQYLYNGINTIEGDLFNNFNREESVFLKLSSEVQAPKTVDNSRVTVRQSGTCKNIGDKFKSVASAYYSTVKRTLPNQYGQLDSIRYLDTGHGILPLTPAQPEGSSEKYYNSGPIFGGDTFISKFSQRRTHHFFTQELSNRNFPDSTEYNYSIYRNIGYPRYWIDTEKWDISDLLVSGTVANRLPNGKYNLDCGIRPKGVRLLNLKSPQGYFHLYNSGVIEFFVESDYNLDYRDYKGEMQNFYSSSYSNLSDLFRSDRIYAQEEFIYDLSYSKQLKENALFPQALDYDPELSDKCFSYYKNRVIYSLPAFKDQKADNWLINLTNNFYDFPLSNFGTLTSMHSVDNQQIVFLFDKSAPYITIGRDELQTENGIKVTIGDAGLFAREPRPLVYTDYFYGNSQSRRAFVNTQYGSFYPSQRQGRIFQWTGKLDEISRNGKHWWFKNYLPSKLLEDFPNYKNSDNTVVGVGLLSAFDNTNEIYYLSKKDYALKQRWRNIITYDGKDFKHDGTKISLKDTTYFENASWTISFDPKTNGFISYHDWHPDMILQGENHFMTIKDRTIWKHNQSCNSFCNFYGVDYPFEIEFLINNGPNVMILKSIQWIADVGKYFNGCSDFHHILDDNFDSLIIHNSEQISGKRNLVIAPKNKMSQILDLPTLTFDGISTKYHKEENKYRVNEFWDITKDRGEFTKNNYPLWTTQSNGYIRDITPQAVDYSKNQFQHKKFRHFWNKVLLSKSVSGDRKIIFKLNNSFQTISP